MSGISTYQGGQSDLELASADAAVLLRPSFGATVLTNLEDSSLGGLDSTKLPITGSGSFVTVGNWTKSEGVSLTNNPTVNKIMSHGKGGPTALIPSEAEKSIVFTPQEFKLINLKNSWGFADSDVSSVSAKGGFTIQIPELPGIFGWQAVLLSRTLYNGKDVIKYWIMNKCFVGDRKNVDLKDSTTIDHGYTLTAQTHPSVPGYPVIFGMCGAGVVDLATATNDYSVYPKATGITVTPTTFAGTVAAGANHTKQLAVADNNGADRTATATYVSDTPAKATVSSTGLITSVASGTANVTATWNGLSAVCAVTVT
jgi:hypothetical protein